MVLMLVVITNSGIAQTERISILTCGTTGTYFPLGAGLAKIANTYVQGIEVSAESSGCSVVNVRLIEQGKAHMAVVANEVVYMAHNKGKFFEKEAATKALSVFMMYPEDLHILTTKKLGIKTIGDLRGKRIRIGYLGGIVVDTTTKILAAHGIKISDIKPSYAALSDAFAEFKDGDIDVLMEYMGFPASGIMDIASGRDVVLVPLEKEGIEKIIKSQPYFAPTVIPAKTYAGVDYDVPTVGTKCMLVASKDMKAETVYKFTKAIFEHLDIMKDTHEKGKYINLDDAMVGLPAPLHPGAEKYYKEIGRIK